MIAGTSAAVIVGVVVYFLWLRALGRKSRTSVDGAARYMAPMKALSHMQEKQALKKSERLGVTGTPGVPLGRTVVGRKMLYASSRTCRPSSPALGSASRRRWSSLRSSPLPAQSSRRRTSATCSTRRETCARRRGRCGCSTRRRSPARRRPGGGTRSPTSSTTPARRSSRSISRPDPAPRTPRRMRSSTAPAWICWPGCSWRPRSVTAPSHRCSRGSPTPTRRSPCGSSALAGTGCRPTACSARSRRRRRPAAASTPPRSRWRRA